MKLDGIGWRFITSTATMTWMIAAGAGAAEIAPDDRSDILVVGQPIRALTTPNSTSSRLGLTPLETPASIAILDGDQIRARGDISIVDAVTRAPGIMSSANPGNGGTALTARGFNGQGSVLQLYDGIRLFPVAGTITFPADPWNVKRIEVLSGPASVLYGQGALGGAINIVTRQPSTDRTIIDAAAGYGSQQTVHVGAGIGGPLGDMFSYRVDGSYRRSDGYVDRGDSRSLALSGTLRFAPSDAFSTTIRHDHGNIRPMEYFGTPLIAGRLDGRNRRRNYNIADASLHYRDNRTSLTTEWTVSPAITIRNTAYRLTSKRLFRNLESYFHNADTGLIDRFDNLGIVHDQSQIGDQGTVKFSIPLGGAVRNDLAVGFDVNRVRLTYENDFGSLPQEDSVDPFRFSPGLFFDTQGIAPRYRTRTSQYAIFVENRLALAKQISIVAGFRAERDRVERWNISYAANGARSETRAFRKVLSDRTWRVGAVYQPADSVSIYGQYATGVDPLGTLTTFSPAQTQFKNSKGAQVEAGVKALFLEGRGSFTLAGYRIVKKNLLIRDPADLRNTTPLQIGQRSAKGIEASVALDLPGGLGLDANGTILDAEYDWFNAGGVSYNGNTPPNVAESSANLWLLWSGVDRLQARAGLRYVGRTFSDNANEFRIPAYVTIDTMITYALTPNLALDIGLTNLFDRTYAVTSYNDEQWILGRPRSLDVSLRAHF